MRMHIGSSVSISIKRATLYSPPKRQHQTADKGVIGYDTVY